MDRLGKPRNDNDLGIDYVPARAHPSIRELAAYWEAIRPGPDLLPGRRHFDPAAVPGILPDIALVEVVRGATIRLRYRLQGTRQVDLTGASLTGRWVDEANSGFLGSLAERSLLRCLADRQPNWRRGPPQLQALLHYAEIERLLLPLARDGRVVDMILVMSIFYNREGFAIQRE